jgi:hypothetical protein
LFASRTTLVNTPASIVGHDGPQANTIASTNTTCKITADSSAPFILFHHAAITQLIVFFFVACHRMLTMVVMVKRW